jgi:hypothetical protein
MAKFMLFLYDKDGQFDDRSHDEMMSIIKEYSAWADKMRKAGRFLGGEKLTDDAGRCLVKKSGKFVVTDGPFAETKEMLGGYFAISANDYDDACKLSEDCPHIKYGGRVELRQIHEF